MDKGKVIAEEVANQKILFINPKEECTREFLQRHSIRKDCNGSSLLPNAVQILFEPAHIQRHQSSPFMIFIVEITKLRAVSKEMFNFFNVLSSY